MVSVYFIIFDVVYVLSDRVRGGVKLFSPQGREDNTQRKQTTPKRGNFEPKKLPNG